MTIKELNDKYKEICRNIATRRLKPAFDLTGALISGYNLGEFADEYRNLEENYHFMLKYTVEGIRDPDRQKVYQKLIVSFFELSDKLNEAMRMRLSPSVVYEKKRSFRDGFIQDLPKFIDDLEDYYLQDGNSTSENEDLSKQHHSDVRRLFYDVWFRDKLTKNDGEALRALFLSPVIITPYKSFIITAVLLSLQRYFDTEKINLLLDAYNSGETEVNQRAVVGLLIILYQYNDRISHYPSISDRLNLLNENSQFKVNLENIILQFIRSKETEKLQQRIRDEILPEMIKISPVLRDKINLDSLMEEGLSEDKNPDWEEIFKDSPGLINKMEEFSELQMEGADVFMGSFAMLKSFPFYNEISNWFIPFFPENPEISEDVNNADEVNMKLMEIINSAPILCNSDKYSFCFSVQSIPKDNREFLMQGVNAELGQLKDLEKDEALLQPERKAAYVSNQFIQDIYRFFKLYPRKGDFEDIFNWRFDFYNKVAIRQILQDDLKMMKNIAEYYFARNNFEESVEIFNLLMGTEQNGEMVQKIAYCNQKLGKYEEALEYYLKAELYDINRLWNLKKIALCYRNLKKPAKALEYYRMAEKMEPENLNIQLNIGHCLLELSEYEEALKVYFKVEYLAPSNTKVWRPIAWCSFVTGKKEQAEKYLLKLIEIGPNKHDYMNMGHVQWSLDNRKSALEYYQHSISPTGFSEDDFMKIFDEDLPNLLNQGIESDDVSIMLDQLRYYVEE